MSSNVFNGVTELFINFTRNCNLNCSYCFEEQKHNSYITKEVLDSLIEVIKNNKQLQYFYLFGGEPFLATKQINYFVEELEKIHKSTGIDFHLAVITNGTIYNEEVKNTIKKIKENLNFYYVLSLDGDRELHNKNRKFLSGKGSYDLAINNSKEFHKDFPDVRIEYHCVINKDTVNDFYRNVKSLFRSHLFVSGTYKFLTSTRIDNDYTIEDYEKVYRDIMLLNNEGYSLEFIGERLDGLLYGNDYRYKNCYLEKDICTNCTHVLTVDIDGEVYPCNHYMSVSVDKIKQFSIYNLLTKKYRPFPVNKILDMCKSDECDTCDYKFSCYICSASVDINNKKGFEYCCNENKKIHKAMENVKFILK